MIWDEAPWSIGWFTVFTLIPFRSVFSKVSYADRLTNSLPSLGKKKSGQDYLSASIHGERR